MKLQNIKITQYSFDDAPVKVYWYDHLTDTGETEFRPYGRVTRQDLIELRDKINAVLGE